MSTYGVRGDDDTVHVRCTLINTPNRHQRLTRDRIVKTAIAFAATAGIARLSMRKLANHLDTGAMSLYNHVANKDELLDAMVDHIAGEFTDPPPSDDWRVRARHIANEAHTVLLRNSWALPLWPTSWPGPNRWRHMENLLAVLAEADFPDEHADLAFHAITLHIQGFTQQQATYASGFGDDADVFARFDAEVDPEVFPRVVDHLRFHREGGASHDEFSFVLDLILDGIERSARGETS